MYIYLYVTVKNKLYGHKLYITRPRSDIHHNPIKSSISSIASLLTSYTRAEICYIIE